MKHPAVVFSEHMSGCLGVTPRGFLFVDVEKPTDKLTSADADEAAAGIPMHVNAGRRLTRDEADEADALADDYRAKGWIAK